MMLKSLAGQYRSRQSLHLSLVLSKLRMLATKKPDIRGGVYVLASSPMAVHATTPDEAVGPGEYQLLSTEQFQKPPLELAQHDGASPLRTRFRLRAPAVFGCLARMASTLLEGEGVDLQVFTDVDGAMAWLNPPP